MPVWRMKVGEEGRLRRWIDMRSSRDIPRIVLSISILFGIEHGICPRVTKIANDAPRAREGNLTWNSVLLGDLGRWRRGVMCPGRRRTRCDAVGRRENLMMLNRVHWKSRMKKALMSGVGMKRVHRDSGTVMQWCYSYCHQQHCCLQLMDLLDRTWIEAAGEDWKKRGEEINFIIILMRWMTYCAICRRFCVAVNNLDRGWHLSVFLRCSTGLRTCEGEVCVVRCLWAHQDLAIDTAIMTPVGNLSSTDTDTAV